MRRAERSAHFVGACAGPLRGHRGTSAGENVLDAIAVGPLIFRRAPQSRDEYSPLMCEHTLVTRAMFTIVERWIREARRVSSLERFIVLRMTWSALRRGHVVPAASTQSMRSMGTSVASLPSRIVSFSGQRLAAPST